MTDHAREETLLTPYVSDLIRRKARRLVGQAGITWSDVPDIEQELRIHLWRQQEKYDPIRASRDTFANRIVENRVRTYLAERRAEKRDPARCRRSLDETVFDDGGDPLTLADTLDVDRGDLGDGPTFHGIERQRDLEIVFVRFRATLPPAERDLFDRLLRMNLAAAARDLGKPRTSLNRVVARLRRRLELAHLAPDSPDSRNSPRHSAGQPGR